MGLRAPLGNWFPYDMMKGKKILFIGGELGWPLFVLLILYMLDNRGDYKDITIIYGARHPDLCYKEDLKEWETRPDVNLIPAADTEYPGWDKRIGFVPTVLNEVAPSPEDTIAITCGPPIMIKSVLQKSCQVELQG